MQRVRSVAPSLAHADPAPALGIEAEPVLQVGGHLEARREHDDVDRVLDSAGDDSVLGDLVDSVPVGVDQVDVRAVERRQVLVVEAHPLAVLAVPRLEPSGGLGILDDAGHPLTDLLHGQEVRSLLAPGDLGIIELRLGVVPHDVGPPVVDQVDLGLLARDGLGEVLDPLRVPAGLQRGEPGLVGRTVVALTHSGRRALEHEQLLGSLCHPRDDLDRRGPRADHRDPLVGQLVHEDTGRPARDLVVPTAGVERPTLEAGDPCDARELGLVQDAPGGHQEATAEGVAPVGPHPPPQRRLVPDRFDDLGVEQGVGVEVVVAADQLGVGEDLDRTRVLLGRHVARLLQQGEVGVGLDVAHASRIAVPVPRPAEVAGAVHHAHVVEAAGLELDGGEHPGEPAADDEDLDLFAQRVSVVVGIGERVPVELREVTGQLPVLGVSVGPDALGPFGLVALPGRRYGGVQVRGRRTVGGGGVGLGHGGMPPGRGFARAGRPTR